MPYRIVLTLDDGVTREGAEDIGREIVADDEDVVSYEIDESN